MDGGVANSPAILYNRCDSGAGVLQSHTERIEMARMDRWTALKNIWRVQGEAPIRPFEALAWAQAPKRVVRYGERMLDAAQAMPRTRGKQALVDAAMALIATEGKAGIPAARDRLDDAVYDLQRGVYAHYKRASRRRRSRRRGG